MRSVGLLLGSLAKLLRGNSQRCGDCGRQVRRPAAVCRFCGGYLCWVCAGDLRLLPGDRLMPCCDRCGHARLIKGEGIWIRRRLR